jgi:hypothetical protein
MKTAMQEFLDYMKEYNMILIKEGIEPNLLIKMLQHKAEKLLEKEKEQIENTFADGFVEGIETQKSGEQLLFPEQYYNQTYKQDK